MGYDGKYGKVTTEHGDIPDDEPVVVFRGRDLFLPEVLGFYASLCESGGSPERHVGIVEEARERIIRWQDEHEDRTKIPDSARYLAGWPAGRATDITGG